MKARVKATGEILEVEEYHKYLDTGWKYRDNTGTLYKPSALDFSVEAVVGYWERLKHQYAGMAMQGLLSNHMFFKDVDKITSGNPQGLTVDIAEQFATALVEKLKEKEERK